MARLEKIRAQVEQKEYNRMVGNVDPNVIARFIDSVSHKSGLQVLQYAESL